MALRPSKTLIRAIRRRLARTTASASAVRGAPKGTAKAGRQFLQDLDLEQFGTRDRRLFRQLLDLETARLAAVLPGQPQRTWGVARKLINLFLRECAYNVYVRETFHLGRSERLLELPLDSHTAEEVIRRSKGTTARWTGVNRLDAAQSEAFQTDAALLAQKLGILRVHLDVLFWHRQGAKS